MRPLMAVNDPDAIHAGLAEIADTLDVIGRASVAPLAGRPIGI